MEHTERFKDELAKVPEKPGVYIMHDADDGVLYVGKAVVLKNRLRSYFQNTPHSDRITVMISRIARFEYIVCDSEYEALLLENNLIKKYKPKYNVLLKDDKGYPYIRVTVNERFPRVMLAHRIEKDGAKYFGPYFSAWTVKRTLDSIRDILPLRPCRKKITDKTEDRPCLNYHIGLCRGACCGKISEAEYGEMVRGVLDFLNGRQDEVEARIRKNMQDAAERLEFELATVYRERLKALASMREKQKISMLSEDDFDVIAAARNEVDACVQIFFVRGGKVLGREFFLLDGAADAAESEIMAAFLKQFYNELQYIPPRIYLAAAPDGEEGDASSVSVLERRLSDLRGRKCELHTPQRGDKKKLCDMVRANAVLVLQNREASAVSGAVGEQELRVLTRIQEIFALPQTPLRIESYDISNLGDSEIDASMVVFVGGKPSRSDYRLFKMKRVQTRSDTDSLEETLERRFTRYREGSKGFATLPDLLLIDGGLGQVNAARAVLARMQLRIPVLGMVKDDRHRSRSLLGPAADAPYPADAPLSRADCREFVLQQDAEIWRFITAVQNETHRVAVGYNRKLTEKRYKMTALDGIEGVGEKRKMLLLRAFGSVRAIRDASLEEISAVNGIGRSCGAKIYAHFHPEG